MAPTSVNMLAGVWSFIYPGYPRQGQPTPD